MAFKWLSAAPQRLRLGRALLALVVGALTGAGLTTLTCLPLGPVIVFVFPVALIVWSAGLFVIAAPIWVVLHHLGMRRQLAAILLGVGLTFAVGIAVTATGGTLVPVGRRVGEPIEAAFIYGPWIALCIAGGIVAVVVWRIAYRPAEAEA